jgi:hypothetical protein
MRLFYAKLAVSAELEGVAGDADVKSPAPKYDAGLNYQSFDLRARLSPL